MNHQTPETGAEQLRIPRKLPVLPLRDLVVYPFIILPLSISRDISINAVDQALSGSRMILLLSQKDAEVDDPTPDDLYSVGTVGVIMRLLKLPDERVRVLVQGVARAQVTGFQKGLPHISASLKRVVEPQADKASLPQQAMMRSVKKSLESASDMGRSISSEVMVIANNLEDPGRLADLAASNLDLEVKDAQDILQILDPLERLKKVHTLLNKELQLLTMQQEINTVAREEMDRSQREFFLRQQLKAIQLELGEGNDLAEEMLALREKARAAEVPENVMKEVDTQIRKLERTLMNDRIMRTRISAQYEKIGPIGIEGERSVVRVDEHTVFPRNRRGSSAYSDSIAAGAAAFVYDREHIKSVLRSEVEEIILQGQDNTRGADVSIDPENAKRIGRV